VSSNVLDIRGAKDLMLATREQDIRPHRSDITGHIMVDEAMSIVNILATLVPILATLGGITYWLGRRFAEIDERFKHIDKSFEDLKGYVDARFNELKGYIDSRVLRLGEAFRSYQEFFVEYLSVQGFLKPLEASMLKNEASRFVRVATVNPITREEWQRIRELLEKEELTLEEALELRELARKVTDEHGDKPGAWKLHIYASIMVGHALRKMREKEEKEKKEEKPQGHS